VIKWLKGMLPEWIKKLFRIFIKMQIRIFENYLIYKQPNRHKIALGKINKKINDNKKIRVVFFAIHSSVWKYDNLYRLLDDDPLFDPIVVVCPVVNYGNENMLIQMDKAFETMKAKKYNVIKAYNDKTGSYVNIKTDLAPDVIFYTNPYRGLIDDRYYITKFCDYLTCYVPYSFFATTNYVDCADSVFFNIAWKIYCETNFHKKEIQNVQRIKGANLIVKGYPGCDPVNLQSFENSISQWRQPNLKKIIWAPHWLPLEIFLRDANYILDIANEYNSEIQIAFKPHPLLRITLEREDVWGKLKTDVYYKKWADGMNTCIVDDDYVCLFWESDALIHNSGSFISEYLVTGKPCLFVVDNVDYMVKDSKYTKDEIKWNIYGKKAIQVHYTARVQSDILNFIKKVIIGEIDPQRDVRMQFVHSAILQPGVEIPSEGIYNHLKNSITRNADSV